MITYLGLILSLHILRLIGFCIGSELSFKDQLNKMSKTANKHIKALIRVFQFLTPDQFELLINSFIRSHFKYCSSIWMFCNRTQTNKINKLQKRWLRFTLNSYEKVLITYFYKLRK